MSDAPRDGYGTSAAELELLLWALWNPIGFAVPLDEYRRYVPQVWKLLSEHVGSEAVAAELERVAREWMEMHQFGDPRRAAVGDVNEVAARLIDWWYWRFDYQVELEAEANERGQEHP